MLAPVVGGYLCLSSVGLLRRGEAARLLADLHAHPAAMHGVGAIAFFVGAALLALHRHWSTPAEIVLDLVALGWTIEGAGMLADMGRLRAAFASRRAAARFRAGQLVWLAAGLHLLAVGVIGRLA